MPKIQCTMENGKMKSSMEMVSRSMQVVLVMKVSTVMERGTDMECIRGLMVVNTMETGKKGRCTVMVSSNGQTVANMTGNGSTAK